MSCWRKYHVYYSDVDRLIVECVFPCLQRLEGRLETSFWERHYVGGPNLRVLVRGSASSVADAGRDLVRTVEAFLAHYPSENVPYSETRAAALVQLEGSTVDNGELTYRNNVVEEHPPESDQHRYASDAAADLVARFRHDMTPLAAQLIGSRRPKREELLRLFFLQPLVVCQGNLPAGCVSYRSHWEGFSVTTAPDVIARIRDTYSRNRERIIDLMLAVVARHEQGPDHDPLLSSWSALLSRYAREAREILADGTPLTKQPSTPDDVRRLRGSQPDALRQRSPFARVLGSDDRFLPSTQYEPAFLVPRVLTNLLYILVASVGLNPVERMALCYFTYSAAEEHYRRDLTETLQQTVSQIVEKHASRWTAREVPSRS